MIKAWYNKHNKFINWRRKDMKLDELINSTKAYASGPETEASKEWYEPLDKRIYPDYSLMKVILSKNLKNILMLRMIHTTLRMAFSPQRSS
jgi:hypothetical protein